jgi:hypothetical protein
VLDLAWVPGLRALSASWEQLEGWAAVADQIEELVLSDYDPPDLRRLSEARALQELRLLTPKNLETLDGVEAFSHLQLLEVRGGRRRRDATANRAVAPTQRRLRLESCPRLTSIEWVSELHHLGELRVTNSGNIESAQPLRSLTAIETLYLYESTRFVDGDLTPIDALINLRDLRLAARTHYRPTVNDLQRTIEDRART